MTRDVPEPRSFTGVTGARPRGDRLQRLLEQARRNSQAQPGGAPATGEAEESDAAVRPRAATYDPGQEPGQSQSRLRLPPQPAAPLPLHTRRVTGEDDWDTPEPGRHSRPRTTRTTDADDQHSSGGTLRPRSRRTPRYRDRAAKPGIACRGITGHLVWTDDCVTAWYVLTPVAWSFRSDTEREAMILEAAGRLGRLAGRRCHLRITSRPFAVRDWAQALDADVRAAADPLPGRCPLPAHRLAAHPRCRTCDPACTWEGFLAGEQASIRRWGLDAKTVYLGVDVARRTGLDRLSGRALAGTLDRQARRLTDRVRELDDIVAGAGLAATPATGRQMEWLLHRSCSLGLTPPLPLPDQPAPVPYALSAREQARWEHADLEEFTGRAVWTCEPFDRTVTITGHTLAGALVAAHVAVLTLGDIAPIEVPEATPWLLRTDLLPFDTEWSIVFEVRRPAEVTREMRDKMARRRSQQKHYAEHDLDPPLELEEQTERSRRIEDEQTHGYGGVHTRIRGWFRVAVTGSTRQEALARAAQVAEAFEPAVTVVHSADQYRLCREFIPGEPLASTAHVRRMPVTMLAAAMPQATAAIGDDDGHYIGFTAVGGRAVCWAPWRGPEVREESGPVPVLGTQGAGKSTLAGLITYKAVRAGVPATVLDPAGMLAALCDLPALAAHAKAIDLLHAEPGTLCPYRVIPDPVADDLTIDDAGRPLSPGEIDERLRAEQVAVQARRRALTYDVLRMLLDPAMVDKETIFCLKEAVDKAPADADASPQQVIDALRHLAGGLSERAQLIAADLDRTSRHPEANLFFPAGAADGDDRSLEHLGLTVLTLRGLVLPNPEVAATEWSTEERFSVPLLHLAAWLTHRLVHGRPRHERKLLVIDEAHAITRSPVGRMLVNTTARDSRKRNTIALVLSQNAEDLLEAGIANLAGPVFVGRTEGETEQRQALQLLGLNPDAAYARDLAALSPRHLVGRTGSREFVVRLAGAIERVHIDLGVDEQVRAALDTTADPARARRRSTATGKTTR